MSWSWEHLQKSLAEYLKEDASDDQRGRKRRRIVAAATDLFLQYGYRKTSISDVARRAGTAKGTIYLYFSSKAELLMHAVAMEKAANIHAMTPITEEGISDQERLRRYVRLALLMTQQMPLATMLISGDREIFSAMDEIDEDFRSYTERMQLEFFRNLLAPFAACHCWSDEDLEHRVWALSSFVMAGPTLMDARVRHGIDDERWADVLTDMVVVGIGDLRGGT